MPSSPSVRFCPPVCTSVLLLLCLLVLQNAAGSADEQRLAVFTASASYSLPITNRDNHEYVALLEVLDPLGTVTAKADGPRWKLRFYNIDAEFTLGRDRAKIRGQEYPLSAPFLYEGNRGLIPVASLPTLLPRMLSTPVTLNDASHRLFVGNVGTRFTAELSSTNPARLVLNFSAPVNPTIATEPGRLRMVFRRDPVVSPASPNLKFGDPTIPSATFSESNGQAEIDINGTSSLIASFSNEGRTITISAVAQSVPAAISQAPQLPASEPSAPPILPGAPAPAPVPRHFFAVIDASHGGDDRGVALNNKLLEKDVTLALARQLRQELQNRGISALVLRDSDANLSSDQRAIFANTVHPVIYLAMHAASDGHGVRLYTAMLPASAENNGPFADWDTAQAQFLSASQSALEAIAGELRRRQIPVRNLFAPMRPLNNVTSAAVAVEIAPSGTNVSELASPAYQQSIASLLANGVAAIRDKMGAPR